MLVPDTLRVELQRFCDPPASVFTGMPTSRPNARERWAHAFRVYVADITDHVVAEAITPVRASIRSTFAADVEAAFFAQLRLDWSMSARVAAEDFADAWRAGMNAIAGGSGGTIPSTSTVFVFSAWTNVDPRRETLADELEALFESPAMVTAPRLQEIAEAFHRATRDLTATSTAGPVITFR